MPSRRYVWMGVGAWVLAALSGWVALTWPLALVALVSLLACSTALAWLGLRPAIEVRHQHLVIGRRAIPWNEIQRVDRTGWRSPLVVRLTLSSLRRLLIVYGGSPESSSALLRQIRRSARHALIDGRPYNEFWGEPPAAAQEQRRPPAPRYRLLRAEDEAEVEGLYQRLKAVGRLDSTRSSDET
jgi:hypothetical protein